MSVPTIETTVGALGYTAARLAGGSLFRPLPPQVTGWDKLRITALLQLNSTYVEDITGPPSIFIGLSSGSTYGFNDYPSKHCVGVCLIAAQAVSYYFDYVNAAIDYYRPSVWVAKKTATAVTLGGATYQLANHYLFEASSDNFSMIAIEIDKGSPNWALSSRSRTGTTNIENTRFSMLTALHCNTANSVEFPDDAAAWGTGNGTLAVDEATDGTLDHLHISWSHTYSSLDLVGIGIRKFA